MANLTLDAAALAPAGTASAVVRNNKVYAQAVAPVGSASARFNNNRVVAEATAPAGTASTRIANNRMSAQAVAPAGAAVAIMQPFYDEYAVTAGACAPVGTAFARVGNPLKRRVNAQAVAPGGKADSNLVVFVFNQRQSYLRRRDDARLAGVEHIALGPGLITMVAARTARRVTAVDVGNARSISVLASSHEMPGEIAGMVTCGDKIFVYCIEPLTTFRTLVILSNDLHFDELARFKLDADENATWISCSDDAQAFAYPYSLGRVAIRRVTAPFDLIGTAPAVNNSEAAFWVRIVTEESYR